MSDEIPGEPRPSRPAMPPRDSYPPAYYPPPQPLQRERAGFLGTLTKLGGMIGLCIALFAFGFYAALFAMNSQSGPQAISYREGEGDKIAIIPVVGMIDSSTVGFVHAVVEDILADDSVKAVVLRIESPGGGATASDEILQDLLRLRTEGELPIVASYGDYAASGGYYVSAMADHIYAQPTTITGSIGVIAPFFTIHELLDKVGVEPQIVTSTAATAKDTASMFRPWTEEDRVEVKKLLDAVQEQFVKVVAEGRDNLDVEEVRTIATGSVMTAAEALESKLIDDIGYLAHALTKAEELGGLSSDAPVVMYHWPVSLFGQMLGAQSSARPPATTAINADTARQWAAELSVPRMMFLVNP